MKLCAAEQQLRTAAGVEKGLHEELKAAIQVPSAEEC